MLTTFTWAVVFVTAALLLIHFVMTTFVRRRRRGEPPLVFGNFFLGSASDFSRDAIQFLHAASAEHGKVFTLRLINQYVTIVMDPHSYELIGKDRLLDFEPIQKQVNWNVFSFILHSPKRMIKETGKTVHGRYLQQTMNNFTRCLDIACGKLPVEGEPVGLHYFTALTIFSAIFNTVFGYSDQSPFHAKMVYKNFEVFHKSFNYFWLGFPKCLFPDAAQALKQLLLMPSATDLLQRDDLSTYIRRAIEYMQEQGQTEDDIKGHHLVYLHVNYNTFRLAFWVLTNLLEHKDAMKALQMELQHVINLRNNQKTNTVTVSVRDVEEMKILDSIIMETCRLSSGVFVVRHIVDDTRFTTSDGKSFLLRKGDRVALYPPATHKDPEVFENPLIFDYKRFVDATFYKDGKPLKNPVMPFGILCPGKRFAILQLKVYIITIITRFTMSLEHGEHAEYDYRYHGQEVLPPVNDVFIRYIAKSVFPLIELAG